MGNSSSLSSAAAALVDEYVDGKDRDRGSCKDQTEDSDYSDEEFDEDIEELLMMKHKYDDYSIDLSTIWEEASVLSRVSRVSRASTRGDGSVSTTMKKNKNKTMARVINATNSLREEPIIPFQDENQKIMASLLIEAAMNQQNANRKIRGMEPLMEQRERPAAKTTTRESKATIESMPNEAASISKPKEADVLEQILQESTPSFTGLKPKDTRATVTISESREEDSFEQRVREDSTTKDNGAATIFESREDDSLEQILQGSLSREDSTPKEKRATVTKSELREDDSFEQSLQEGFSREGSSGQIPPVSFLREDDLMKLLEESATWYLEIPRSWSSASNGDESDIESEILKYQRLLKQKSNHIRILRTDLEISMYENLLKEKLKRIRSIERKLKRNTSFKLSRE